MFPQRCHIDQWWPPLSTPWTSLDPWQLLEHLPPPLSWQPQVLHHFPLYIYISCFFGVHAINYTYVYIYVYTMYFWSYSMILVLQPALVTIICIYNYRDVWYGTCSYMQYVYIICINLSIHSKPNNNIMVFYYIQNQCSQYIDEMSHAPTDCYCTSDAVLDVLHCINEYCDTKQSEDASEHYWCVVIDTWHCHRHAMSTTYMN